MAFFDAQLDLQDSDEEHVGFAKYYLEDLRFLYKYSEHENKKVCDPERYHPVYGSTNNMILIRNGRGSFAVPLSSRLLLLILPLLRVLRRFLASMTLINQLLQWLVG